MTLRVIVVDDEPLARQRLRAMLERNALVEIVGEACDADQAADAIARLDPDIAFVDVRMPGRSGVELARSVGPRPAIVFTTAYREHAVEAFDTAAADYLLKPIAAAKLTRALHRACDRLARVEPRITARTGDAVHVFAATAIARFHATDKYTAFEVDGVEHLIERSLDELEQALASWGFARVHRGELVRIACVRTLRQQELELIDGTRVRVSRRLLPALRQQLRSSAV